MTICAVKYIKKEILSNRAKAALEEVTQGSPCDFNRRDSTVQLQTDKTYRYNYLIKSSRSIPAEVEQVHISKLGIQRTLTCTLSIPL